MPRDYYHGPIYPPKSVPWRGYSGTMIKCFIKNITSHEFKLSEFYYKYTLYKDEILPYGYVLDSKENNIYDYISSRPPIRTGTDYGFIKYKQINPSPISTIRPGETIMFYVIPSIIEEGHVIDIHFRYSLPNGKFIFSINMIYDNFSKTYNNLPYNGYVGMDEKDSFYVSQMVRYDSTLGIRGELQELHYLITPLK